jgi:hypothetical protein
MGLVLINKSQSSIREPCENQGRLRHCIGIQTPIATGLVETGKAGVRFKARSQDIGLAVLVVIVESAD